MPLGIKLWANITLARTETIAVNNGNLYYTGGNLGIGTTDPSEELHIAKSSNADLKVQSTSNGDDARIFIEIGKSDQYRLEVNLTGSNIYKLKDLIKR